MIGHPIHQEAADVLENMGGVASDFAARQLTRRIVFDADLVLAMTKAHRDKVLELAPHKLSSTFALAEAAALASMGDNNRNIADLAALRPHVAAHDWSDVPDPIGQSRAVFEAVGSQIAELLTPVLDFCQRACADSPY